MNDQTAGTIDTTSLDSIISTVRYVFPDGEVCEDIDGQVVIYTGLRSVGGFDEPLQQYPAEPKGLEAMVEHGYVSDEPDEEQA